MMNTNGTKLETISFICTLVILATGNPNYAQTYELKWSKIASGGGIVAGDGFEMRTTIGQHDAGPMSAGGAGFLLTGGFLAITGKSCTCVSDVNEDGRRDGNDIAGFMNCLLGSETDCACADVDSVPGVDISDVATFVTDLLTAGDCP